VTSRPAWLANHCSAFSTISSVVSSDILSNKAFMDIRLRPGIATPPEEDRATAIRDVHNKFREDRSSGSRDMLADRQTDTHTDRQTN